MDIAALQKELEANDFWNDIVMPEPNSNAKPAGSEVKPPPILEALPKPVVVSLTNKEANEVRLDWKTDNSNVIVEKDGESDAQFKSGVEKTLKAKMANMDPAFRKIYEQMLLAGAKDGEDPTKQPVVVDSVINQILKFTETKTKAMQTQVENGKITTFDDMFYTILGELGSVVNELTGSGKKSELRVLAQILNEYRRARSLLVRPLSDGDSKRLSVLDPELYRFLEEFKCQVDSKGKCVDDGSSKKDQTGEVPKKAESAKAIEVKEKPKKADSGEDIKEKGKPDGKSETKETPKKEEPAKKPETKETPKKEEPVKKPETKEIQKKEKPSKKPETEKKTENPKIEKATEKKPEKKKTTEKKVTAPKKFQVKPPKQIIPIQPETTINQKNIIIDETKDMQNALQYLVKMLPTDIDAGTIKKVGTALMRHSINSINKMEQVFQTETFYEIKNSLVRAKQALSIGKKVTNKTLDIELDKLKKKLDIKVYKLLSQKNRDKDATFLTKIEQSIGMFDNYLKSHQGNNKQTVTELLKLDKTVKNHIETLDKQLVSKTAGSRKDWVHFRQQLEELVNYELSNVETSKAAKRVRNISKSLLTVINKLGEDIVNGNIKDSVKESTANLLKDLENFRNSGSPSGFIIGVPEYKKIVKSLFRPIKELIDGSGRVRIKVDSGKFREEVKSLRTILKGLPRSIPHYTKPKQKVFEWVEKALPKGVDKSDDKTGKSKVQFINGKRYQLVEIKQTKPEFENNAEEEIKKVEQAGNLLVNNFKQFLNSSAFENKFSRIVKDFKDIYGVANANSNGALDNTNTVNRLKQEFYLHSSQFRLLQSFTKYRKLAALSTTSLNQKDADMLTYLQRRLRGSMASNFKNRILTKTWNSLTGSSSDQRLLLSSDFIPSLLNKH